MFFGEVKTKRQIRKEVIKIIFKKAIAHGVTKDRNNISAKTLTERDINTLKCAFFLVDCGECNFRNECETDKGFEEDGREILTKLGLMD